MRINESAPVQASSEIEIAADVKVVWNLLTAINDWASWNPDVKWASLDGEPAKGSEFRWKSGPGTITSTIQQVERPRLLAWTGKTFGVNAVHVWRLEPRDGKTFVRTEESWEGTLARIFRGAAHKMLQNAIDAGLKHLKAEAERRSTL